MSARLKGWEFEVPWEFESMVRAFLDHNRIPLNDARATYDEPTATTIVNYKRSYDARNLERMDPFAFNAMMRVEGDRVRDAWLGELNRLRHGHA